MPSDLPSDLTTAQPGPETPGAAAPPPDLRAPAPGPVSPDLTAIVFRDARTPNGWLDTPVPDTTLERIYELMKWAPTSANCSPARFLFLRTGEAKEKLREALSAGNIERTMRAPVTVIVATDMAFFEDLPRLFPHADARSWFANDPDLARETALRNATLQGGYFLLAARALGLDCGPMSGFDQTKVDQLFLAGTTWRSNFLINLGHGDPAHPYPRSPRLHFDEACRLL